ncbi:Methyltransferase type 12 [Parafrankia sp. Ea1.12]|uniref:class I SAM-dependent methyltransferase n=1 Tax=Parafrankia sp. Ea1.12 TaxID=573499 RepID=UPI000DA456D0|nr:class I SAM-dependent methyltransferase [Parafrankia sp. Ea1.12]SQD97054.1 Methyltransferase type 12 [Parafrankia sp. Ea1.12]
MSVDHNIYRNGTYRARNPDWHDGDGAWKALQIGHLLRRNGIDPKSVCDVGCGTGRVLAELAVQFPAAERLVGTDTSDEVLDTARGLSPREIEFVNTEKLDQVEHFDLVLMVDLFEHIEDYLGFLRSFRGRADRFVFHIPLDLSAQALLRVEPILHARRHVGHLHYFCRETALATLDDAGYRVLDERYTPGALELDRPGRRRAVARIPRKAAFRLSPHLTARVLGGFSLLVLCDGGEM